MTILQPSLWRRLVNTWRHNRRGGRTIDLTVDGFLLSHGGRRGTELRWQDINRIDAGICDCLTFDFVCLQLLTTAGWVEIEEMDEGFRQFELALLERWPQLRDPWDALLKADGARHETLWRRDG